VDNERQTMEYKDFIKSVNEHLQQINDSYDAYKKKLGNAVGFVLNAIADDIAESEGFADYKNLHSRIFSASAEFYSKYKDTYNTHWAKGIERIAKNFPAIKETWDEYIKHCKEFVEVLKANPEYARGYEQFYLVSLRARKLQDVLNEVNKRIELINQAKPMSSIKFAQEFLNIYYLSGKSSDKAPMMGIVSNDDYWHMMFIY